MSRIILATILLTRITATLALKKVKQMKQPTTPYAIAMMNRPNAITREFLISQGWELVMEHSLFEIFHHSKHPKTLKCQIGMYGEFSLSELHGINSTPDRTFDTTNQKLTQQDYFTIVSLLGIQELNASGSDTGK